MSEKSPISVIITFYNDWQYLDQAIKSVIKQTLLPSEIIIVDDGSHQSTAQKVVEKYVNNEASISIFFYRKENGGASSARNLGIQKASEKYIAFLDVDDSMLPINLLEKYELIRDLSKEYFGVFGGAQRSTGELERFPDFDGVANPDFIDIQGKGVPGGSPFFLFSKQSLVDVGGFDERLKCNEDFDIIIRLIKIGKKVKGCTQPGFYRNMRVDSLSRPNDPDKLFESVSVFLDKAERFSYYSNEYLNQRKMDLHIAHVKRLFLQRKYFEAFRYARKGFKYSKPITKKQKIVYWLSFSFI